MKYFLKVFFFLFSIFFCFAQEDESLNNPSQNTQKNQPKFSLNDAINIALENNYEIKKQRYALASARAQYRQIKGTLDIEAGAQAQYSQKQNPVDENDPNYALGYNWLSPAFNYGVFSDNTLSEQTGGSVFLKKLFSFGLETKLSYTVQRQKNKPQFTYDKTFDAATFKKYEQEDGRNTGEIALELSLPLFKSFKNSLASLQLESAKDLIEQMEYKLQDTISQSMIAVSQSYWNYFLTCKNVEQLEILQRKIEERNGNMENLIKAGVRSRNDLLAMQVNVNENRRQLQEARVQQNKAKIDLMTSLGVQDFSFINEVENPFNDIDLKSVQIPRAEELNEEFFNSVEESRTDLLALKKNMEMAAIKVRYSKADRLPDATLNFSVGSTGATYSDEPGKIVGAGFWNQRGVNLSGMLGASIKLGNNTKGGSLEQAEAEYNTSLNEYTKARNTVVLQIHNAQNKLEIYKNLVSDADEVLTLDKKLYENEQKRFNAGLITVDNLLQQDQKYLSAENSYCQVLINYMQAILEYKYYTANLVAIDMP